VNLRLRARGKHILHIPFFRQQNLNSNLSKLLASASFALLSACATVEAPDPYEAANRTVFAFNEGVDKVVFKPVAKVYSAVIPAPVRTGVGNVFANTLKSVRR
jgi:phospholipid-binding lipoprotein MlaA